MKNQEYRNGERNAGNAGNWENIIFRGMSPNIPGNVLKHSRECDQIFGGMLPNILGNVPEVPGNAGKYSRECRQTFWRMSPKHFGECLQTFREMSPNIPGNDLKHSLLLKNDAVKR